MKEVKFCDLFSGLGGFREGFENALNEKNIKHKCILTSEIKKSAKIVYLNKYKNDNLKLDDFKDIRQLDDLYLKKLKGKLDIVLGGFVCKSFSKAGNLKGLNCDINGDLFFQITRILKNSEPKGFILENVDNLVIHDKNISKHIIIDETNNTSIEIGNTFKVILDELENLNYKVVWKILNNKDFGMPQNRKRIFIVGIKKDLYNKKFNNLFNDVENKRKINKNYNLKFKDIQEYGLDGVDNEFTQKLLKVFKPEFLIGKKINDKRGKENNIHTWNFSLFSDRILNDIEKLILTTIMINRRKKIYKDKYQLKNDGIPLLFDDIYELISKEIQITKKELNNYIDELVKLKYLKIRTINNHTGFDIISGRLQFYFNNFINPNGYTLTLTATDAKKNGVIDGNGIRHLSDKELCLLFGFNYEQLKEPLKLINMNNKFDLFGNSLGVNIVYEISKQLIKFI
jgi:DNA (cytosine-5)-methyltransferase 1